MPQLTIKLSAKADALIAQLQKQIFNRRRKKITAAGVVESLVESGAKSQSDKRYASSWINLIKDIEKAAKASEEHGSKPSNISADEWAMILSHRSSKGNKSTTKASIKKPAKPKAKTKTSKIQKASQTKHNVSKKSLSRKEAVPEKPTNKEL